MHQPATRRPMTDSRYTEMGGRGQADQFFSLIREISHTDVSSLHASWSNAMLAPQYCGLRKSSTGSVARFPVNAIFF